MNAADDREEELFGEALKFEPGAPRAAFLQRECADDPVLLRRLQALVEMHEQSDSFLRAPCADAAAATVRLDPPPQELPGAVIGRYKLLENLGEGGCGVVYVAEQTEPIRRRVALKVIRLGMDTRAVVARFEAERQALAMMDHPNIARVLDAGATESGRPYFVMELVRGIKITDYCDQNKLSTRQRLDLFIQVCHAIQHAHQKGIIHRDIKPSNILVTLHDGVPVPKVIDFGIAKATEGRLTDATVYTKLHQFIGTPAYMSPEQAEMSGLDIDTRSDIYSLGVLLYELLTGRPPFDPETLVKQGIDAMRRTIREQEPPRPSTRLASLKGEELTTAAKRRSLEARRLISLIKGDLDWIAMKCLEKDRARRYETANALAADLQRHLGHEPVIARAPGKAYRVQKFVRRNKLMVSAAAAVAAALVLGMVTSTWQAWRARLAEERIVEILKLNEAHLFEKIAEELALEKENGDNTSALALAIASLERGDKWDRRRAALIALWKGPTHFRLPQADEFEPAGYVSFSPGGKWLATGSRRPHLLLWPSDGGAPRLLPVKNATRVLGATYSPDGQWLLSVHHTNGALVGPYQGVLWNGKTLEQQQVWKSRTWAPSWFHPDGLKLLAYSLVKDSPYPGIAWWPIHGSGDDLTELGSPRTDAPIHLMFPPDQMFTFYPSADLRWIVSWEGTNVYVSSIGSTNLGSSTWVGSHERSIVSASLSEDGEWISSADEFELRLWSSRSPGECLLRAPSSWQSAIFDLSRSRLFSYLEVNHLVGCYDLRGPAGSKALPFFPYQLWPDQPCSTPGGEWVAVGATLTFAGTFGSSHREVFLYPTRNVWPFHVDLELGDGVLSPDGSKVIAKRSAGRLELIELEEPQRSSAEVFESPEGRWVYAPRFDPSGERLLVGTLLSGAWLVDLETGKAKQLADAPRHAIRLAFSPSGERMAMAGGSQIPPNERFARVLDLEGKLLARLNRGSEEAILDLEFLTDTKLLVATEKALRWWSTEAEEVRVLREGGHSMITSSERRFVTCSDEGVWLYNRSTLARPELVPMETTNLCSLAIAPDESFVVAGTTLGELWIWHLDEDRPHYLPGLGRLILDLWIDPRGYWIAAISGDRLSYWPVPRGRPLHERPLEEFLSVLRAQTNIRAVAAPDSHEGYRETAESFPGWQTAPTWQEWYSEEYMEDPPWKPMLDLEALAK